MYYHITWFADGCVEIMSMNNLDFRFISLYERCIKSKNRVMLSGKLLGIEDYKGSIVINTQKEMLEKLLNLEYNNFSDDYQELEDYYNEYIKEDKVNEIQKNNNELQN